MLSNIISSLKSNQHVVPCAMAGCIVIKTPTTTQMLCTLGNPKIYIFEASSDGQEYCQFSHEKSYFREKNSNLNCHGMY